MTRIKEFFSQLRRSTTSANLANFDDQFDKIKECGTKEAIQMGDLEAAQLS